MKKNKNEDTTIRNWVKKAADELGLKPSRFRDRKNDYARSSKHRKRTEESTEVPSPSRESVRAKRPRSDQDRGNYPHPYWDYEYWLEQEEVSPFDEEV